MTHTFDASKPIYRQLADQIYWRILRGELRAGEKLPSVRETAVEFGVNPNTVSRTYSEMERDGVVESKRGQGTFVSEDQSVLDQWREGMKQSYIRQFVQEMKAMGFSEAVILNGLKTFLEEDNE
ncbi:GntR family transcriptional regulator [Salibacterium aidingense]|uniref:GntR family transcriptional regulator n=1 Tax=Salibacterium aidingense TaxID=384933 RepID=UPI000424CE0D|nr:GntR family transcriptional regulator [Salibacterium aidingense]